MAMTNLRQEFGDLTLDESLAARERIAGNLGSVLNVFAEKGIKPTLLLGS